MFWTGRRIRNHLAILSYHRVAVAQELVVSSIFPAGRAVTVDAHDGTCTHLEIFEIFGARFSSTEWECCGVLSCVSSSLAFHWVQCFRFVKALAAVRHCGRALEYAADELKSQRSFILAAMQCNGVALNHAHPEFRKDRGSSQSHMKVMFRARETTRVGCFRPVCLISLLPRGCTICLGERHVT